MLRRMFQVLYIGLITQKNWRLHLETKVLSTHFLLLPSYGRIIMLIHLKKQLDSLMDAQASLHSAIGTPFRLSVLNNGYLYKTPNSSIG